MLPHSAAHVLLPNTLQDTTSSEGESMLTLFTNSNLAYQGEGLLDAQESVSRTTSFTGSYLDSEKVKALSGKSEKNSRSKSMLYTHEYSNLI